MSDAQVILPATGLHYNVPVETYNAWPAVRHSTLKQMDPTPAHCRYALDHPTPPSAAMRLGSALNAALLEPDKWATLYVTLPEGLKRPTEAQLNADKPSAKSLDQIAAWDAWQHECAGKEVLTSDELAAVQGMAEGVRRNAMARRLIEAPGSCEVSALWQDAETKLMCKGRYDALKPAFKFPTILELKSARSASGWLWARQIAQLHYESQAACYLDAYQLLSGQEAMHVFIVVENEPPHECAAYSLTDTDLQSGRLRYRKWLNEYAACVKSGVWPGFSQKIEPVTMPMWAQVGSEEML